MRECCGIKIQNKIKESKKSHFNKNYKLFDEYSSVMYLIPLGHF